ncbi:hypothetical protein BO99DRAFT_403177 [Aspergillus violaceofuscus CBS 115571]|uniref:Secreted protein n=1 Tax=Aspergillus violaceofuscus (strain CBS 115571) TaxID=1450538 RepID=A0A2V5HRD0_ASPV1|nr:hypothetical protein BO99DRAFT_403177 [Aspergillus violaceofuscus CBS 115571]
MADASCLLFSLSLSLSLSLFSLTSQTYSRDSADERPCATQPGLSYGYTTCARLPNSNSMRAVAADGASSTPMKGN